MPFEKQYFFQSYYRHENRNKNCNCNFHYNCCSLGMISTKLNSSEIFVDCFVLSPKRFSAYQYIRGPENVCLLDICPPPRTQQTIYSFCTKFSHFLHTVSFREDITMYALRIKHHLPIRMSDSKINLPRSKMTCPDSCLNHLT